jgi:hypothetical protein
MVTSLFPHSPFRTGLAPFSASGSSGIGDFLSWDYSQVCHFLRVRCRPGSSLPVDLKLHQALSSYLPRKTSIPWRPSPCARLSRALSTMTPPTLARFIAGLLSSPCKPPTFTARDSATLCRWCLICAPIRALRNPSRELGRLGLPTPSFSQPLQQFGGSVIQLSYPYPGCSCYPV